MRKMGINIIMGNNEKNGNKEEMCGRGGYQ